MYSHAPFYLVDQAVPLPHPSWLASDLSHCDLPGHKLEGF